MIVDNFDLMSMSGFPDEANAVLVIYSNAVLAFSVALECLQFVVWWNSKGLKIGSGSKHSKLESGQIVKGSGQPEFLGKLSKPEELSFLRSERDYHPKIVSGTCSIKSNLFLAG